MKRIVLTAEDYYPVGGGIQQFIQGLATFLISQDKEVFIYTKAYPKFGLEGAYTKPEGTVIYSSAMVGSMSRPFSVMANAGVFSNFIKDNHIDLVFANNHNSLAWITAAKKVGVPVIYGCHGVGLFDPLRNHFLKPNDEIMWRFPTPYESYKVLWQEPGSAFQHVLKTFLFFLPCMVDEKFRNYWRQKKAVDILNSAHGRYGNSTLTADLFYNKINTFGFPLALNSTNRNAPSCYMPQRDEEFLNSFGLVYKQYVVCPGRIHRIKGQEYAIRALKKVRDKSIKLVLVGTPSLHEKTDDGVSTYDTHIQTLVDTLGVRDRVVFTGLLDFEQMRKIYTGALVCVVPSVWFETFGYVTIESMACETPVIITNNCGSAACITKESGFIIERKTSQPISDIINTCSTEQLVHMGKVARKQVTQYYDWSVLGPKYIDMMQVVMR